MQASWEEPVANWDGLLVLDKPMGMTSRAAVNRAQPWFPRSTRIGHTGTLDPLATGVLVLCVGQATRLTEYVQALEKVYLANIRLGARSDSDDAEGAITPMAVEAPPDREKVRRCLECFRGEIEQVPPAYSAARVTGRRAYDLARSGAEVPLSPRQVTIHEIRLLNFTYPDLELEVRCGKGTYIRALARDLGEKLGCGAYLSALRRTRVGHFEPDQAVPLDADRASARARLLPIAAAVRHLPALTLDETRITRLAQGQGIRLGELDWPTTGEGGHVAVFSSGGDLAVVGYLDEKRKALLPEKVLVQTRK